MKEQLYLWMAIDADLTQPLRLIELLNDISRAGINLTRLDDTEPLRRSYSESTVHELLMSPPVTIDLPCRSLIGRGKGSLIGIRACSPLQRDANLVNSISATLSWTEDRECELLDALFIDDFFSRHRVAYAVLDTWSEFVQQRVAGTMNERLPGIFWLNWLSKIYVDAIGEAKIRSLDWFNSSPTPGGCTFRMYESLRKRPNDLSERIELFRDVLGFEKFVRNGWSDIPQLRGGSER